MTESYLDGLLDELVPADARPGWDDVLQRAHRAQRRYVAVVVAIAVLVLAPATWAAVRAFEGTPATPPVHRTFEFDNKGWAKFGKFLGKQLPQAVLDKAHGVLQVQTKDGPLDLWAAPSTQGGTCFLVGYEADIAAGLFMGGSGGCQQGTERPLDAGILFSSPHPWILYGWANGTESTVEAKLQDGQTLTLPVVEHYFLAAIPSGSLVGSITGRDAAGNVIATWTPPK